MKLKLLDIEFTNEILLSILPFETGYLLSVDDESPCEHSVTLAMMLRSVDMDMNPASRTLMQDPYLN